LSDYARAFKFQVGWYDTLPTRSAKHFKCDEVMLCSG
jgi:hypothetical protein